MASSDYLINLKGIPKPRVSDNFGVQDIPQSIVSQSGSSGEGSIDSGIPGNSNIAQTGFIFGQYSGLVSVAAPANGATTAEYQAAFASIYSAIPPKYGDLVTLRVSGEGAFDSRWLVFLNDDSAPSNATISFTSAQSSLTWYAYNLSATSVSGLTDALDQYLGKFDESGTIPRDDDVDEEVMGNTGKPFQISVSNTYETSTAGVLSIGSSTPQINVASGIIEPMDTLDFSVPSNSTTNGTTPAEGECVFIHIYVKYQINFTGSQGSRVAQSVTGGLIEFYASSTDSYREGGLFSSGGSVYTHYMYLGSVAIVRRKNRRYAKITQVRSGKISGVQNFNTTQAGSSTDSSGSNIANKTRSGIREVVLCMNGEPFSTFILTGPLTKIT